MEEDEYEKLTDILADAVGNSALSDWERQFVSDLNDKVEANGNDVYVSTKMWEILNRIRDKL